MKVKEKCVRVHICKWCGASDVNEISIWKVKCGECGTTDLGPAKIIVPERSLGMKNKYRDKLVKLQAEPPASPGHFAGTVFLEKDSIRIAICPWCGLSVYNFEIPEVHRPFVCSECGTESSIMGMPELIFLPMRSIGSRNKNIGLPFGPDRGITAHITKDGKYFKVCPWCGDVAWTNLGRRMTKCKGCGVAVQYYTAVGMRVPEESFGLKDKYPDRHKT